MPMRVKILITDEELLTLAREAAMKKIANPSVRIVDAVKTEYYAENTGIEVEIETDPAQED